ncbi:MAG: Flagellar protein [Ignavibacteria bacterium]|nr:Flagellar protein [Ignavibacteria bacterium]
MLDDTILKGFLTMAAFVAGLGILLFLLKKYAGKVKRAVSNGELQVVSKINLNQKSHLYIVKAGSKTLLIGSGDGNVAQIADLSDESEQFHGFPVKKAPAVTKFPGMEQPKAKSARSEDSSLSFGSFIRSAFKK